MRLMLVLFVYIVSNVRHSMLQGLIHERGWEIVERMLRHIQEQKIESR